MAPTKATADCGCVPDDVWARVQPHFSGAELVDLTLLVGAMNIWNRFAIAFRKTPS